MKEIIIDANELKIYGNLMVPAEAESIVIFAHGSGSGRFSSRNQFVAKELNKHGFATMLIDLLTEKEEEIDKKTKTYRFDIDLLASRLLYATHYVEQDKKLNELKVGYYGASTGAAAAIVAAAQHPSGPIKAVVSRGGRPDLAEEALSRIKVPTLLVVGSKDTEVLALNKRALKKLSEVDHKELKTVPGATHLFSEPGAMEKVAEETVDWFKKYLT